MASIARRVDQPLFNCAAVMGDRTLKINGGFVTSFNINRQLRGPLSFESYSGEKISSIMGLPPEYVDTTIKLMVPYGQVVFEPTKEQRIRNKLVGDCTVDELLFAIQKKLEVKP